MKEKRNKLIQKLEELFEYGVVLCKNDCKGIDYNVIRTVYSITKASMTTLLDEQDALPLDEVADRYSCTIPTIYNRLQKHNLPAPYTIEDKTLVRIPRSTLDELDKFYEHKK